MANICHERYGLARVKSDVRRWLQIAPTVTFLITIIWCKLNLQEYFFTYTNFIRSAATYLKEGWHIEELVHKGAIYWYKKKLHMYIYVIIRD